MEKKKNNKKGEKINTCMSQKNKRTKQFQIYIQRLKKNNNNNNKKK